MTFHALHKTFIAEYGFSAQIIFDLRAHLSMTKSFQYFICLFAALAPFFSFGNDEKLRSIIHALSYIEGDYSHAVADGKIIDEGEYEEMLEFSESVSSLYRSSIGKIPSNDTSEINKRINALAIEIQTKADAKIVSASASFLKNKFTEISGIETYPKFFPNLQNGEKIYAAECSKCHGAKGYGDGKDGLGATPPPRNFHDAERIKDLSAFAAFNSIRLGIQGTIMLPHPSLSDKEVWDVAFYVLSLRHQNAGKSKPSGEVSLENMATLSDEALAQQLDLSQTEIAFLRTQQAQETHHIFLKLALEHLNKCLEAYKNADYAAAAAFAANAYLEGIEPVEMPLKAANSSLSESLEQSMIAVRKLIKERADEEAVEVAIDKAKQLINQSSKALEEKEYSFLLAFWMAIAIILREGLEAFLVIMAVLAVLNKADLRHQKKYVHAGWIAALVSGVFMWMASEKVLSIGFANIELLEGIIAFVAVGMLLYIGFWLHGKSSAEAWKKYVSNLVKTAANSGSGWGLAAVSFFVVFREVFESVLFLSAINIESKGQHTFAIALGLLVALALVSLFAVVALKFSAKLPIQKLFKISSIVMSVLAVVLAGKGARAFQETGLLSENPIDIPKLEVIGFYPSLETIGIQLALVVLVVIILNRPPNNKA